MIAEIEGSHSLYNELQDIWRSDKDFFVRSGEERFIMDMGYTAVVAEAVAAALKKFKLTPKDFARAALYSPNARQLAAIARRLGFDAKTQIQDTLHSAVGDTGTAMALMCLVAALEETKAGDRILLAGYGNGCDVFSLKVTGAIEKARDRRGIKKHLASKRMLSHYNKYLRWRELIQVQPAARPPIEANQPSPMAQWRENQGNCACTAPAAGTAGRRNIHPREYVSTAIPKMKWTPIPSLIKMPDYSPSATTT